MLLLLLWLLLLLLRLSLLLRKLQLPLRPLPHLLLLLLLHLQPLHVPTLHLQHMRLPPRRLGIIIAPPRLVLQAATAAGRVGAGDPQPACIYLIAARVHHCSTWSGDEAGSTCVEAVGIGWVGWGGD